MESDAGELNMPSSQDLRHLAQASIHRAVDSGISGVDHVEIDEHGQRDFELEDVGDDAVLSEGLTDGEIGDGGPVLEESAMDLTGDGEAYAAGMVVPQREGELEVGAIGEPPEVKRKGRQRIANGMMKELQALSRRDGERSSVDLDPSEEPPNPSARTTKSGRRVQTPPPFIPDNRPTFHRKGRRSLQPPNPAEQPACVTCGLKNSPRGNRLVMCDGCEVAAHQICHSPPIDNSEVEEPESLWFCAKCESKRDGRVTIAWETCLTTENAEKSPPGFSLEERRTWLKGLSKTAIVDLIERLLDVDSVRREVKIWPKELREVVQSRAAWTGAVKRLRSDDGVRSSIPTISSIAASSSTTAALAKRQRMSPQTEILSHPSTSTTRLPTEIIGPSTVPSLSILTSPSVVGNPGSQPPSATTPPPTDASIATALKSDGLPSYEDMIVAALSAINDPNGSPPRILFEWMTDSFPLTANFRPSASQALQKAYKRGRLLKHGTLYKLNPDWDDSKTAAARKPTRKPKIGREHPILAGTPLAVPALQTKPIEHYATPQSMVASASTSAEVDLSNSGMQIITQQMMLPPTPAPAPTPPMGGYAPVMEQSRSAQGADSPFEGLPSGGHHQLHTSPPLHHPATLQQSQLTSAPSHAYQPPPPPPPSMDSMPSLTDMYGRPSHFGILDPSEVQHQAPLSQQPRRVSHPSIGHTRPLPSALQISSHLPSQHPPSAHPASAHPTSMMPLPYSHQQTPPTRSTVDADVAMTIDEISRLSSILNEGSVESAMLSQEQVDQLAEHFRQLPSSQTFIGAPTPAPFVPSQMAPSPNGPLMHGQAVPHSQDAMSVALGMHTHDPNLDPLLAYH